MQRRASSSCSCAALAPCAAVAVEPPEPQPEFDTPTLLQSSSDDGCAAERTSAASRAHSLARQIAPAMRLERRGAVGADDPEVLEAVVVRHPVDVIEYERHLSTMPVLPLAAQLARARLEPGLEQSLLELPARIVRSSNHDLVERSAYAPARRPRVQGWGRNAQPGCPSSAPSVERSDVATLRPITERSQHLAPVGGLRDGRAERRFSERGTSGMTRTLVRMPDGKPPACRKLLQLGSPDLNRDLTAPKAGGLPLHHSPVHWPGGLPKLSHVWPPPLSSRATRDRAADRPVPRARPRACAGLARRAACPTSRPAPWAAANAMPSASAPRHSRLGRLEQRRQRPRHRQQVEAAVEHRAERQADIRQPDRRGADDAWSWCQTGRSGHAISSGPSPPCSASSAALASRPVGPAPLAISRARARQLPTRLAHQRPTPGPAPPRAPRPARARAAALHVARTRTARASGELVGAVRLPSAPRATTSAAPATRSGLLEAVHRARGCRLRDGQRADGPREHVGEHRRALAHQLDQLGDRGRLARDHLVGVVGDEADQRERQLELAAQDRLGTAGLADGDDAAGGELGDLGRRVEAGAVDVAVGATVTSRVTALPRRLPAAPSERRPRTASRAGSSGRAAGRPARRRTCTATRRASGWR